MRIVALVAFHLQLPITPGNCQELPITPGNDAIASPP